MMLIADACGSLGERVPMGAGEATWLMAGPVLWGAIALWSGNLPVAAFDLVWGFSMLTVLGWTVREFVADVENGGCAKRIAASGCRLIGR